MNKKYTFRTTDNEDYSKPNNNYNSETDYIITDGVYDFSDYLYNLGITFEQVNDTFYVVEDGERTGEAYWIISEEDTDEDITER